MAAVLTAIAEALMDLSGGFYVPSNGDVFQHDINFDDAAAEKGFYVKVLESILYLSKHVPADALTELQTQNLTLTGNVTLGTGKHLLVSSRSETRILPVSWATIAGGTFELQADGSWKDTATGSAMIGTFRLPHGVTLNEVHFDINPDDGHGGVPATKPQALVYSQAAGGSALVTIATCTDASASAGAYDAQHYLSATGLSVAIDASTKAYSVYLVGEFGGNSAIDLVVYPYVKVVYTRTIAGED